MTRMPQLPSMEWNYKDQLSATSRQVVKAGEPEKTYYVYDARGQRARLVTESDCGKRRSERLLRRLDFRRFSANLRAATIAMERETLHIMDDKQRIALVETKTIEDGDAIHAPTPVQRYQLANHLGSASVEVDEAGGLITYEEYSPYGNTTYQAGTMRRRGQRPESAIAIPAKERDEENPGFTYHGARYYAPWLGRWTSVRSCWDLRMANVPVPLCGATTSRLINNGRSGRTMGSPTSDGKWRRPSIAFSVHPRVRSGSS